MDVSVPITANGRILRARLAPVKGLGLPASIYDGHIPDLSERGLYAIWLTAPARERLEWALREVLGVDPEDFIISATVHGNWKRRLHQGVCFARSEPQDVTWQANPRKSIPSSAEREALFRRLLRRCELLPD